MKSYIQLAVEERVANISIYGQITARAAIYREWCGIDTGDRSAMDIRSAIAELDVDTINVYINSYGGEVAEALAMYSALVRHKATVKTFVDGFACSAATIVFCAGDERIMGSLALLMIHNCMSYIGYANSNDLRKAAEDNDVINQSSVEAYKKVSNLSEEEIKEMMDAETWMSAADCLEYGFATEVEEDEEKSDPQQSAFPLIREKLLQKEVQNTESDIFERLARIEESIKQILPAEPLKAQPAPPIEKKNTLSLAFKNLFKEENE